MRSPMKRTGTQMSEAAVVKEKTVVSGDRPTVVTRSVVLFLATLFAVSAAVLSVILPDPKPQNSTLSPLNQVAVTNSAGENSEAWYCPGPMPVGAWPASHSSVYLANLGKSTLQVTLEIADSVTGQVSKINAVIPAASGTAISLSRTWPKSFAAVSVMADGPGLAATEVLSGQDGESTAACVNSTAKTLLLSAGSTLDGKNINLSLYNPAQTAAVVNVGIDLLNARSQEESLAPAALQGVTLQPGQIKTFDVGKSIPQEPSAGLVINAIGGQIVAGAQLIDPGFANLGEGSLVSAAVPTANRWIFSPTPEGYNYLDTYSLLNPNNRTVKVSLTMLFNLPSLRQHSLKKFMPEVSLPPDSETVLAPPLNPPVPSVGGNFTIPPKTGTLTIKQADNFLLGRQTPAMVYVEFREHASLPLVIERTLTVVSPGKSKPTTITPAAVNLIHAYYAESANYTAQFLGLTAASTADMKAVSTLPTLPAGTATVNALSAPAQKWLLLPGSSDAKVGQLFTLYNPGNKTAKVALIKLNMVDGGSSVTSASSAGHQQPFITFHIPPHAVATLDPDYLIGEPGSLGAEILSKRKIVVGSIDYSRGKGLGLSLSNALPIG